MSAYRPGPNALRVPPGTFFTAGPAQIGDDFPLRSSFRSHATFTRTEYFYPRGLIVRWDQATRGSYAGQVFVYMLRRGRAVALENKPGTGLVRERPASGRRK